MELIITPKGLACLAMQESGLVHTSKDLRCDKFWELFCSYLRKL